MSYICDIYMVNAMIRISDRANQILNIVKARQNLNDKSEAIEYIVGEYGKDLLEPELRPEFIERMKKIAKQKTINVGTVGDFRKRYVLK